jgi:hypothetical protein
MSGVRAPTAIGFLTIIQGFFLNEVWGLENYDYASKTIAIENHW